MPALSPPPASPPPRASLRTYAKALRVYQWVKNVLVFLPLMLAHQIGAENLWLRGLLAFFALSFCASATYVINDLLDREQDRLHPTKRHRPFASGALRARTGLLMVPVLLAAGVALGWATGSLFFLAVLALYFVTTLAYSFVFKREPIVDVLVLAGLYTLRIFAGGAATGVDVSSWLLAFSLFFFLTLALVKRYAELRLIEQHPEAGHNRRGYTVDDAVILRSCGTASGYLSVLVLVLYTSRPEVVELYTRPGMLWLLLPLLLYWQTRLWLLAHRGVVTDDPILFTVKDPTSYLVGVTMALILALAAVAF